MVAMMEKEKKPRGQLNLGACALYCGVLYSELSVFEVRLLHDDSSCTLSRTTLVHSPPSTS
jgi:hypothetical protein